MDVNKIIERYDIYKENKLVLSQQDTKNVFITPFLKELGYDLVDYFLIKSDYMIDEYQTDYVILKEFKPFIIIKSIVIDGDLTKEVESLRKAFNKESTVDYAILTNGIEYWFFKEREVKKSMDSIPFFKYHLINSSENDLNIIFKLFNPLGLESINENIQDAIYRDKVLNFLEKNVLEVSPIFSDFVSKSIGAKISKELIEDLLYSIIFGNKEEVIEKEKLIENKAEDTLVEKSEELIDMPIQEYLDENTKPINQLSIVLKMFQNKPKMIKINEVEHRCNTWKEIYTTFIEFIIDNYDIDLELVLSDKAIYSSFDKMPKYLKDTPNSFKQLKNGLYLNTVVSQVGFINRVNDILLFIKESPSCFSIEEII